MLTKPHSPVLGIRDPRMNALSPRAFHPGGDAMGVCSCGVAAPHEVARRRTFDGGLLVVMSTGEVRLWWSGGMAPQVVVWVDRYSSKLHKLLDWVSVMSCGEVAVDLGLLHWGLCDHPEEDGA